MRLRRSGICARIYTRVCARTPTRTQFPSTLTCSHLECRYHPELLQKGRAVAEHWQPSPPPVYGDNDLDLPEAFTYGDDFPVTPPRRTVTIDQEVATHFRGQEVLADFGFADTGALGLKWLPAGDTEPAMGRNLEHAKLAEALRSKTEFTKQEWEVFGIKDLRTDHFIKSGHSYFQPAPGPVLWTDCKAAPHGTEKQTASKPTKNSDSEYVAC